MLKQLPIDCLTKNWHFPAYEMLKEETPKFKIWNDVKLNYPLQSYILFNPKNAYKNHPLHPRSPPQGKRKEKGDDFRFLRRAAASDDRKNVYTG